MRYKKINVVIVMITFLAVGVYRWCGYVIPNNQINRLIHGWFSQTIPFVLDNQTKSIVLHSNKFAALLDKQRNVNRTLTIYNVVRQTLCQFQNIIMNGDQHCCNRSNLVSSDLSVDCETSLGLMPAVTSVNENKAHIHDDPPNYQHTQVYVKRTEEPDAQYKFTCPVNLEKRKVVYDLLLYWIRLAEQHNLIWWLNYGSLLGAVRNGDFIPYDHDADISVLGSAEPTIRRLATGWQNLSFNKVNLLVREQDYCVNDHMPRLNCQGIPVRYQMDPCAFCTPLARLISGYFDFLDIFLVNIELRMDSQGNPVDMGVLDEALDRDRGTVLSYPIDYIFPLTTCTYMGLKLPCPRKSHAVLSQIYGKNFMQPMKLCNTKSGHWYNI